MKFNVKLSLKMTDYCIAYNCPGSEHVWKPVVKGCYCPQEKLWSNAMSALKRIDAKFDDHNGKDTEHNLNW